MLREATRKYGRGRVWFARSGRKRWRIDRSRFAARDSGLPQHRVVHGPFRGMLSVAIHQQDTSIGKKSGGRKEEAIQRLVSNRNKNSASWIVNFRLFGATCDQNAAIVQRSYPGEQLVAGKFHVRARLERIHLRVEDFRAGVFVLPAIFVRAARNQDSAIRKQRCALLIARNTHLT